MSSFHAQELRPNIVQPDRWTLSELAGRMVEISSAGAAATLTLAFGLVLEAQQRGEFVGWVTSAERCFYPPDVAQSGIDLAALTVVRVPQSESIARAGEKLLRSRSFGLVVLDLGAGDISVPLQSRMMGLANRHYAALVCLTEKESKTLSLSSLVSVRAHAQKWRVSDERCFRCCLDVLKDKRHGPTWVHQEVCRGAAGLC
jgi:recombination protein RecA